MGRFDEAIEELQQLCELVPKEAPVHFLLGKIYRRQRQLEAAILSFTAAMYLDAKNANHIKAIIDRINAPDTAEEDENFELT